MSSLRRRLGSESEQNPLVLVNDNKTYDKHEGKLKNYQTSSYQPTEATSQNLPKLTILNRIMTSRDRTAEFVNVVKRIRDKQMTRVTAVRHHKIQSHAEFMMKANVIGKNITSTFEKLEKLTLRAKDTSIYSDSTSEIQDLTYIIKEDINSLNQQIAMLQEMVKQQRRSQYNGKHLMSLSTNVVLALQSKLATMSSEFKQTLEVSTETLKYKKDRRGQFSQGTISSIPRGNSLLDREETSLDIPDTQPLLLQQTVVYDQSDDYAQSRAETMQNIESTIVELGGIFQQLAFMVKEQEEMVERIDSNVEATTMNVEAAHSEILKYFQSVMSNRWLMIKIFGVLIFFFMFFIIFMT